MSAAPQSSPATAVVEQLGLKVTGLHIRGLRAIRSLDLPKDGLGWDGQVPDLMMIGGVNGSGKTTLLEFLTTALESLVRRKEYFTGEEVTGVPARVRLPRELEATEGWVDFLFAVPGASETQFRFIMGSEDFFDDHATGNHFGYRKQGDVIKYVREHSSAPKLASVVAPPSQTGVVYIPCDRDLVTPEEKFKSPGKKSKSWEWVHRWRRPIDWKDSFEAELYDARWEYLNAKEEGKTDSQGAQRLENYNRAFEKFFHGSKSLAWEGAELVVRLRDQSHHTLSELSSGEKQVIMMMGEILQYWRPGSLILIDEPELHLHTSWQTKLWESLIDWQRERGGQVIVATQSNHLFKISEPGTKVLLGGESL